MTLREDAHRALEQPAVLQRVLDTQLDEIARVASAINRRAVDYVLIAARGTSDHAGVYAHRRPVGCAQSHARGVGRTLSSLVGAVVGAVHEPPLRAP